VSGSESSFVIVLASADDGLILLTMQS